MFQDSCGITESINANGKKKNHHLPFAFKQLPFKSKWRGPSLELAGEGGDVGTWYPCIKQPVYYFYMGTQEAPGSKVSS